MELSTPPALIMQKLQQLGWEVESITFSGGQYVAKGKNAASAQAVERYGETPEMALAAVYQHAVRADAVRRPLLSAWRQHWYSQLHDIAKAYADLPPFQSNAVESWQTLAIEDSLHAAHIQQQVRVEFVADFQPYESPREMVEDVHQKRKLIVSTADSDRHPLWSPEQVLEFRMCHDVLGICQSGGGWSWPGANAAVRNHLPYLSAVAREALFVEVIGRTAYETVYRGLGAPKVALLTEFFAPVAEQEGEHIIVPKISPESSVDSGQQSMTPMNVV